MARGNKKERKHLREQPAEEVANSNSKKEEDEMSSLDKSDRDGFFGFR
jgi:hypothetical protein